MLDLQKFAVSSVTTDVAARIVHRDNENYAVSILLSEWEEHLHARKAELMKKIKEGKEKIHEEDEQIRKHLLDYTVKTVFTEKVNEALKEISKSPLLSKFAGDCKPGNVHISDIADGHYSASLVGRRLDMVMPKVLQKRHKKFLEDYEAWQQECKSLDEQLGQVFKDLSELSRKERALRAAVARKNFEGSLSSEMQGFIDEQVKVLKCVR